MLIPSGSPSFIWQILLNQALNAATNKTGNLPPAFLELNPRVHKSGPLEVESQQSPPPHTQVWDTDLGEATEQQRAQVWVYEAAHWFPANAGMAVIPRTGPQLGHQPFPSAKQTFPSLPNNWPGNLSWFHSPLPSHLWCSIYTML